MQLFYSEEINGSLILLTGDEAVHCSRVLRMKPGDGINITDGMGTLYKCELTSADPKKCFATILSSETERKRDWKLHIAISPTKNAERIEWFAEKATEIGVDEITPLITGHSERTRINTDRIKRILVSAMKQSLKYTLPHLNNATSFRDFISLKHNGQKFIGYCETGKEEDIIFKYKKGSDVVIMIGPEGDFSASEVSSAIERGFEAVSLGTSRLRTETAGVVACQVIHTLNSII